MAVGGINSSRHSRNELDLTSCWVASRGGGFQLLALFRAAGNTLANCLHATLCCLLVWLRGLGEGCWIFARE
ncbi:hypothetical protein Ddc_06711 [Ditylenchus destructor]|nr:hypothetical protein Ddc_06711 [Ditylenchus destructor]